ncbi:MAG: adenylate/guanylate cyclase domain-containing protein [Burkholderiales bacterium]|jgi:class 3 adenylate cyclase|nr:adenylate/guanylate cyclase domain-containing protein [Burkholderiales bacterium]
MTATERPVAILFADVSGSTTLYERLGDREALRAVESVLDILRRNVAAYRGRVVKTIGDEVMAAFPDADGALQAASDMQNGVASLPAFGDVRLAIRVGFHYGPALEDKADFFGDAVNTAARMAGLAKAGQIITTAATVAALAPLLRASTREVAALAVKGKQDAVQVCEVLWQPDAEVTMLAPKHVAAATEPVLKLSHGARTLVMDSATGAVQIGRDASNTFAVSDRMASRLHGRIERRGDKFYYVDLSTNGTYLTVQGDAETVLRRDQAMLRGRGTLAFGHSASQPDADVVSFVCEDRPKQG